MKGWLPVVAALGAGLAMSPAAGAQPPPVDLKLRELPLVEIATLRMRLAAAPEPAKKKPLRNLDPDAERRARLRRQARELARRRQQKTPLHEKVTFRFNLGFGLDGGEPSGSLMASGGELERTSYAKLRTYGFGDAVVGTRGIVSPALSTYLAANFRFDSVRNQLTAVPHIRDNSDVGVLLIRSGYAQSDGLFQHRLLRPLFARAGRQFRYGAAIAHFDGLTVGYETPGVSVSVFGGRRVALYGCPEEDMLKKCIGRGPISGGEMRLDMWAIKEVPLVLAGSSLLFDGDRHFQGRMILRWSEDVLMQISLRVRGRSFARQRLQLRARISDVTTIRAEIENRSTGDWLYDLVLAEPVYKDASDPRRYLNLGLPLPRVYAGLRGGTVLLDNIDLLIRGGAAIEHGDHRVHPASSFSASFVEAGAAAEVRLRRTVGLGTSLLWRRFFRDSEDLELTPNRADLLPATTAPVGEKGFIEGGLNLHYSAGARRFSARAELYTRGYRFYNPYDPILPAEYREEFEFRSGGRFGVDGWAGDHLRLRAEYDVTLFAPVYLAPELRGMKTLRVLAEGSF